MSFSYIDLHFELNGFFNEFFINKYNYTITFKNLNIVPSNSTMNMIQCIVYSMKILLRETVL